MASQGPNNGSTFVDDAGVGTQTWSNPSNAQTSNDVKADVGLGVDGGGFSISHYLKATGFGFSIPAGATIDGVVVEIERSANTASSGQDYEVKLVKGGTIQGNNKASASSWPTTDTYATYGGAADLWGLTLAVGDVNASNFGCAIACANINASESITAYIDHVRITVYYTEDTSFSRKQISLNPVYRM